MAVPASVSHGDEDAHATQTTFEPCLHHPLSGAGTDASFTDEPTDSGGDTHATRTPFESSLHHSLSGTDSFDASPTDGLTAVRVHYLKKALVQQQFAYELDAITSAGAMGASTLAFLGPPFAPPLVDAPHLDLPFLRFIFHRFVLTFPLMSAAPKDFYSRKLQPFVASVLARNLTTSPGTAVLDDGDHIGNNDKASRKRLQTKVQRTLSLLMGSATKLVEKEDVVRLTQADLERLEATSAKRMRHISRPKDRIEVNVVGVRSIAEGRMRSRVHEAFLIRTRRSRGEDVFVARRYGDFKTLAAELRKAHPDEMIASPPPKDRTVVTVPAMQSRTSPFSSYSSATMSPSQSFFMGVAEMTSVTRSTPPMSSASSSSPPARLAREKNRLTLRAYLHNLMRSQTIASSPVLKSFLFSGPTTLSPAELEDAQRREEADRVREDGRKRFASEIALRVDGLRAAVKSVKGDILGKEGLMGVFGIIKVTPHIYDLPEKYQSVIEWARISLASTVFHHFVAADNASESFAGLKRVHGLMPYFMLKAALKISNPIGMIRSVLDLFLAQPFGGRSLLQRMFTSSLTEEVRALQDEIESVKDKVNDPVMCAKICAFVYAPRDAQEAFIADAEKEKLNVIVVVLRSPEEPVLSRLQMHRLARARQAHAIYLRQRATLDDSDDDDGPQDDDAWLLEDLKVLTQLYTTLRDREQLIALIFEGVTSELLKDIITILYAPLAQVYRAANIADSLSDLQNFINDVIKTVEQVENSAQEDSHKTVQAFIDLVQRHEQSFYHFVHNVHSKGHGLFDSLMRWVESFLTFVRDGLGPAVSLEYLLPHRGPERTAVLAEVDSVARYHYKLKVLYEDKLRRRFWRAQRGLAAGDADAEDEAARVRLDGVVGEIDVGELLPHDNADLDAQHADEEESSEDDSESEETSGRESESVSGSGETGSSLLETTSSGGVTEERGSHQLITTRQPGCLPDVGIPRPASESAPQRPLQKMRSLRSMTFSMSSLSITRKGSADVPPVPSLTSSAQASASRSLKGPFPRHEHQRAKKERKKKKKGPVLQPPELHHISQLRPIFVEMMRPLLQPPSSNSAPDPLSR